MFLFSHIAAQICGHVIWVPRLAADLGKYRQQEQAKAQKIERDNTPGINRWRLLLY